MRKVSNHWGFDLVKAEERIFKATLLWSPVLIEVDDYVNQAASLQVPEDVALRVLRDQGLNPEKALARILDDYTKAKTEDARTLWECHYGMSFKIEQELWWQAECEDAFSDLDL